MTQGDVLFLYTSLCQD